MIPGAEDRGAPEHNQIQPHAGRQPDAHLVLQQVPLPDAGGALLAHRRLQAPRGADQSLVHHPEAQTGHQLVTGGGRSYITEMDTVLITDCISNAVNLE